MTFSDGILINRSFSFSVRIVKLCKYLREKKYEYVIIQQMLRSGTSVGANVHEATFAQSDRDFISKLSIALKEANETHYWISLINAVGWLDEKEYASINKDCEEIIRLLASSIKKMKQKLS